MNILQTHIATVGVSAFAAQLGCSKQLVSHWRVGRQAPSPKMARRIEDATGGKVRASDIRPDIFIAAA
ncbi:MAG: helix-turn-helix domain-containing protein [Alphaproteobacteria bacterium]|nr:helix-turn-helix domain-containing protein [Alphaproteobacteria bacterium]